MDKKTILAFVLIGIIVVLMPYYYKLISPAPAVQEQTAKPAAVSDTVKEKEISPAGEQVTDTAGIKELAGEGTVAEPVLWQDTAAVYEEKFALVETPYYIAKFSSSGGKIISFRLKEYSDRRGGITEMIMKNPVKESYYPNAYLTFQRSNLSTDKLNFHFSREGINIRPGESGELILTAELSGGTVRYVYTFDGDNYRINLNTSIQGLNLDDEYYFRWDGGVNVTELDTVQDLSYSKAYAMMGGVLETFDVKSRGEKRISPAGQVSWIAVRAKYFEIAMIPEGNSQGIDFAGKKISGGKNGWKQFNLALKMEKSGNELNQDYILFIGPMDSQRLSSLRMGLEETMNWGWVVIKPFSKVILWSFKLLHHIIPNYGIVIIIFSVVIKLILWPLSKKQNQSMKQMQALSPYLKELKEKYKGDPQKFQKEQMRLFKENKINPYGGCLPMILQMPILFALFIVFRSTIELRGAPFMLWIKDLSLPDTILDLGFTIPMYGNQVSILPIIMGVTTFFQSKSTATDPNQKMIVYFMPIFLTLLFNSFPSGLTLYYTLFNVLSIAQMKMTKEEARPMEVHFDSSKKKAFKGRN